MAVQRLTAPAALNILSRRLRLTTTHREFIATSPGTAGQTVPSLQAAVHNVHTFCQVGARDELNKCCSMSTPAKLASL